MAAEAKMIRRWRRNMDVTDDTGVRGHAEHAVRGVGAAQFQSLHRHRWDSPEFAVTPNDERWILPKTDPIGKHAWYQAQPLERQIEIGMWRQANVAKVGLHFESILIRGLMEYSFWTPNGSPEYRYCLHEAVEECNHTLMFQEMVNRIGADVPGMPRLLKWIQPFIPLVAGPLPIPFWFGILAGEEPIDHTQKNVLREGKALHPIMERVMAIHVAEEARHISFAHEYLRKRVPHLSRCKRFWLSLYVPLTMRILCSAIIVPPRAFWKEFDIPRSVRKDIFFRSPESRQMLRDMFGDVRMLCSRHRLDEPVRQADVADLQDQRRAQPLPQRAAAPAPGLSRLRSANDAPCDHPVVLQRRVLRLRLPGELHPSVAGRARVRHRRDALHRSRWRAWTAARASRRARSVPSRPTRKLDDEQLPFIELNASFYPKREGKLPPTSKLAAGARRPAGAPAAGGPLTRGDRRLRTRGDVRRRRAADPAGRRGQRLREAADAIRSGARRRRARPPDHQAGHRGCSTGSPGCRGSRSTSTSRSASTSRTPNCWRTTTPCSTRSVRPTTVGSTSRAWDCRAPAPPPRSSRGSTATPNSPTCRSISSHERVVDRRQRQRRARRGAHPDQRSRCARPHRHLRPRARRAAGLEGARGRHRRPARPRAVGVHAARAHRADRDARGGARRRRPRAGAADLADRVGSADRATSSRSCPSSATPRRRSPSRASGWPTG